ncbi:MAG: hypothetical protein C0467_33100 [Planctomycetaceae bacterium]|nr:hypothetical protein [Planctomycetaceae bacterium]
MLWGLFGSRKHQSREYLKPGRLEDVIALIQVLGLDKHVHRGENALVETLKEKPTSGENWCELSRRHPEFFRVYPGRSGDSVALIARHLTASGDEGSQLSPEYIHGLVEAAIRIHHGQLQRKQILRATWAVVAFTVLPSLGSVAAAIIAARGR